MSCGRDFIFQYGAGMLVSSLRAVNVVNMMRGRRRTRVANDTGPRNVVVSGKRLSMATQGDM